MRSAPASLVLSLVVGGCAVGTERQALGYGDYVALNCEQLGQEAVNLMRRASDRSKYLVENGEENREAALRQLDVVKQVSADKQCGKI